MIKKFRILAAGDLHGDLEIAKYLSKKAVKNKSDLVVLAGDINGLRTDDKILEPFFKAKQKVAFVPGNWEDDEDMEVLTKRGARNIHTYYLNYGDFGILGVGTPNWNFSIDKRDFELLKANFERIKTAKKVLVSHVHAAGTKAEFSGFGGDKILRKVVKKFKPDLLISAHIHEAEGLESKIGSTRVIHVGKKGTIIEI